MATFQKRGDTWRVRIIRRPLGIDESATFPTKAQAQAWATKREAEILAGARGIPTHNYLIADAIDRFVKIETDKRRGGRWEAIRLAVFRKHKIAHRPIGKCTSDDIARWRDERLTQVSPSSVAREMNLWAALFSVAVREWKWIHANPVRGVKRPDEPPARRRGITSEEATAIVLKLNGPAGSQVKAAFLIALETAMRAGEILGLSWDHVDLDRRVVTLPRTKNGDSRQVPLSIAAVNILSGIPKPAALADDNLMPSPRPAGNGSVFTITGATLDTLFRRARDAAAVDMPSCATVRFHDARGEAITRMSRRLDVLELARVVGHRDLKSLMSYYHSSAEELAKKLD